MLVRIAAALCALTLAPLAAEAQWKTAVLPVVGSSPETGGQYGLAVLRTRLLDDSLQTRPSSFIANATTAYEGQRRAFPRGVPFEQEPHFVGKTATHEIWIAFCRDPERNLIGISESRAL